MTIQLDHFFILTEPGAPQADLLSDLGLVEASPNVHPGQGTANRRFKLSNTFIELIYIRDPDEAIAGPATRMRIVERASVTGASPFGIVVRRTTESNDDPFPGWRYYPQYFNADQYFNVGENSDVLEEPLCICMPATPPSPQKQPKPREPFVKVTELRVSVPVGRFSAVLRTVGQCACVKLTPGEPHHMEIVFNEGQAGESKDLRPDLPLGIYW